VVFLHLLITCGWINTLPGVVVSHTEGCSSARFWQVQRKFSKSTSNAEFASQLAHSPTSVQHLYETGIPTLNRAL
jgi:hypothetical protein